MPSTTERLRGEFLEMPGLKLTAAQVQRFCGVDPSECQQVLDLFVESGFLERTPDGQYELPEPFSIAKARAERAAEEAKQFEWLDRKRSA